MSEQNQLPEFENAFSIESLEGNFTKRKFSGDFKHRIPTLKINAAIDKHFAILNGGLTEDVLPAETIKLHYMIAYLKFTLVEAPNWWKDADYGYDLRDSNVVEEIFNKARSFEDDYIKKVWGDALPAKKEKKKSGK